MGKLSLIYAQTAIRGLLLADATLMAMLNTGADPLTGVYDGVPDDAPYPYISFGEKHTEPWDVFGQDGNDDRIMIYCWSQARGDEESLLVASRVNELLHGTSLDLTADGFDTVGFSLQLEMLDTMREPDGRTRKCISRYKIQTQES